MIGARLNWLLSHGKGRTWGDAPKQFIQVDIEPKRGRYDNELGRFRYDVMLTLDEDPGPILSARAREATALVLVSVVRRRPLLLLALEGPLR